jgi:hypothetical protein
MKGPKMISSVSNATQAQAGALSKTTPTQKPAQSKTQSTTSTDSVAISNAAQAMVTAMKEASETSAQTAGEAAHGDLQAVKLLAKETAARAYR